MGVEVFGDPMGQSHDVLIGKIRTRYYESGKGPPLVLVHGGDYGSYASAMDWESVVGALGKFFTVYAVDKLGQGFTDMPAAGSDLTIEPVVEHLSAFVEHIGVTSAVLAGHSRGALPVASIAIDRPDLVRCLIVFSSNTLAPAHPSTPTDFYELATRYMGAVPTVDELRREPEMNSYSTEHVGGHFLEGRTRVARYRLRHGPLALEPSYRERFRDNVNKVRAEVLERVKKGELLVPTQIIWGRNDPSAPVVLAHQLFELVSAGSERSSLHILNAAGHYVYREHPRASSELVVGFVKSSAS